MIGTFLAGASILLGVVALTVVALLAWSIRREDTANTLAGRPVHPVDGIARSLMDVHFSGIVSAHDAPQRRFTLQGSIQVSDHPSSATTRPQHIPRPRF